jgi:hypothetical protein
MYDSDQQQALQNIAARPHHHPTLGKRFFDVGTLERHFEWVQSGEIQVTPDMVADRSRPARATKGTSPERTS